MASNPTNFSPTLSIACGKSVVSCVELFHQKTHCQRASVKMKSSEFHSTSQQSQLLLVEKTSSLVLVTLVALLTGIVLLFQKNILRRTKSKQKSSDILLSLPGPKYVFPFIGNALQLWPPKGFLNTIKLWCQQYGSIYKVMVGGNTFVVISSPEMVKSLFNSTNLNKIPCLYNELAAFCPNGLIMSNGSVWKTSRKILLQSMSIQNLKSYVPMINKHCSGFVEHIDILFRDGKSHPINTVLNKILFNLITELVTGMDVYGTLEAEDCRQMLLTTEDIVTRRLIQPWLRIGLIWKLHPLSRAQKHIIEYVYSVANSFIDRRKQTRATELSKDCSKGSGDDAPKKFVVDILMDSGLDKKQIAEELLFMLVAGHDTTASALHFFCFEMASHPQFQLKCRQEIESVVGKETFVTWDHLNKLQYIEMCINETLRMFPSAPLFGRELDTPLDLGNNTQLPAGTNVVVSPWIVQRNPEYFPNPEQFNPIRFSPGEVAKRPVHSFIPFAAGKRNCLGYLFAMAELKAAAVYILRNFELKTEDKMNEIPILPMVVLKPERDFVFTCTKLTKPK